ncbi:MAG: 1-acyl-sn-glycerol-3-phosphate acyltransferase [Cyclobacteriaceae bacterium]|nr:1-acyl-sn-glycerol-3-phosphate acyltransferase [Cyclobacteriaceae bacterium]MCK5369359.1 1-acyl-sn-glycerol-3-phosphate acyltransferase [Cyclobacteriaceae bacterium]
MIDDSIYNEIRPYRDHEFREVIDRMLNSPMADLLITTVFPDAPLEDIKNLLREIDTIKEFQEKVIYKAMLSILSKTSSGLTHSGTENIDNQSAYLFISNHRDIILDPSLLNTVIFEKGFETAEVAIGDNLLETPWVKDLARLNKSFIVKRNLSVRELIISSKLLSNYISETITQKNNSVWIAQREGRAKDGNDRTQPGLLNMIGMSAKGSLKEHYMNMNIIPVSISYEHDPCDVDKVRSLYAQKFFGGYIKEKNEDNLAMRKGILGYKGKLHIHFGSPIREEIASLSGDLHKNELIQQIGDVLDRQIIGNYQIQKSNRIAYDILFDHNDDNVNYSTLDKEEFTKDIDQKVASMAGEKDELISIFLDMYARPYQNQLDMMHKKT